MRHVAWCLRSLHDMKNVAHTPIYRIEQLPEPGALLQRYLRREFGIHAHLNVQSDARPGIDTYNVCAWLKALPGMDQPLNTLRTDPFRALQFDAQRSVYRDQKFTVLVGVRETDKLRNGVRDLLVRPIRSRVRLKWRETKQAATADSRQFFEGGTGEEVLSIGGITWERDQEFLARAEGVGVSRSVQLPSKMVKGRPVIVEGIAKHKAPVGIDGLEGGYGVTDGVMLSFEFLPKTNGGFGAAAGPSGNALAQFDFEPCPVADFRPTARQVEAATHEK
jgi:hypothetical protein